MVHVVHAGYCKPFCRCLYNLKINTPLMLNCHFFARNIHNEKKSCDTQCSESGSMFQLDINENEYTQIPLSLFKFLIQKCCFILCKHVFPDLTSKLTLSSLMCLCFQTSSRSFNPIPWSLELWKYYRPHRYNPNICSMTYSDYLHNNVII